MTETCDKCGRPLPATDRESNSETTDDASGGDGLVVQTASYCDECGRA